jgi:hypothetical protein
MADAITTATLPGWRAGGLLASLAGADLVAHLATDLARGRAASLKGGPARAASLARPLARTAAARPALPLPVSLAAPATAAAHSGAPALCWALPCKMARISTNGAAVSGALSHLVAWLLACMASPGWALSGLMACTSTAKARRVRVTGHYSSNIHGCSLWGAPSLGTATSLGRPN